MPRDGVDPGFIPMHRLNALEYDNTVNELFGLSQHLAEDTFIPDEKGTTGFDNEASALTMTAAEFQQYFSAADSLVEQVFANATLLPKIVTCKPAAAADATCLDKVIGAIGLRAYRRPLAADEITRFQKLAADAVASGEDFNGSVKQVVKMMLSSIPFLYRTELDPECLLAPAPAVEEEPSATMVSGLPVLIGRDVRCSGCPMSMISLGNVHWGSAAWAPPIVASTSNKAASLTAELVQRFVIFRGIPR